MKRFDNGPIKILSKRQERVFSLLKHKIRRKSLQQTNFCNKLNSKSISKSKRNSTQMNSLISFTMIMPVM